MSDPQNYTVGYICALTTESVAVQAFLDERHDPVAAVSQGDNNSYALGKIGNHNVVIANLPHGEYGLVNATCVAKDMLHTFPNIRIGLMVGVGGGVPSPDHDVRLGDVVVGTPANGKPGVVQYDFGKAIQDHAYLETGVLNKPPAVLRTAISQLQSRYESDGHQLEEAIAHTLQHKIRLQKKYSRPPAGSDILYKPDFKHSALGKDCSDVCGKDPLSMVPRRKRDKDAGDDILTVHYGLIASGNTLMRDAQLRDTLAANRGILCFEMEAAGVVDPFPCTVIRGICDYADTHKNKTWQGYAAMAAAAFSKELLCQIPPNKVEAERMFKDIIQDMHRELDSLQQVSHGIQTNLHEMRLDNHDVKIKRWLSPADPSVNGINARERRHPGTGAWFLSSDYFSEWKNGSRQHLWLYGMVGCGKTVLSTTILDHFAQKDGRVMLPFYFDFADAGKQKVDDMLRCIIFQLYTLVPDAKRHLNRLFESLKNGQQQPDTSKLSLCLKDMLSGAGDICILLDALDECSQRRQLLTWMNDFVPTIPHVQFILTSRYDDDFERSLSRWVGETNCIPLNNDSIDGDIRSYVKSRLEGDEFKRWATLPQIMADIIETVGHKANGMFKLVACQLDRLAGCRDREEIETVLRSLPADLDSTYRRILDQIPVPRKKKVVRLLLFLAYAERPLAFAEAIDVIAIRHDERRFDAGYFDTNDRLPCAEEITGYCSSLTSVAQCWREPESFALQLAHSSVKEFLMSSTAELYPNPKVLITETCLTYLNSMHVEYEKDSLVTLQSQYPFARLAAETWVEHATEAEESTATLEAILNFLQDEQKFRLWLSLFGHTYLRNDDFRRLESSLRCRSPPDLDFFNFDRTKALPLYFACLIGLVATTKRLVLDGADVNAGCLDYDPPLLVAAGAGDEALVRLLLDLNADIHVKGFNDHDSALQAASASGDKGTVQLLLEQGANASYGGGSYSSPLEAAAAQGNNPIVSLLLDYGADIDSDHSDFPGTALYAASSKGKMATVQLLIKRGANVNARDTDLGPPLQGASENGHMAIVKVLLQHGADVNIGDALEAAAGEGHMSIVRLLLEKGANPNSSSRRFRNALQAATQNRREAIVQVLLENGADPNIVGGSDGAALYLAAQHGYTAIARLLLKHGADVEAEGTMGRVYRFGLSESSRTALFAASEGGTEAIVRLLLDKGAAVDARSNVRASGTALQIASKKGHEEIVQLLLERNADANAGSDSSAYSTALQAASERGDESIVRLLLKHGADANITNSKFSSALCAAAEGGYKEIVCLLLGPESNLRVKGDSCPALIAAAANGHDAIVELLLSHGASVDAGGVSFKDYRSALHGASNNGHESIVKLLLGKGAEVKAGSISRGNCFALPAASNSGHGAIVRLLLEHGADVNAKDGSNTALIYASAKGHEEIVRLLLRKGAEVNARTDGSSFHGSALCAACYNGHESVVQLLLKEGAEVNARTDESSSYGSALCAACYNGHESVVQLLLKGGADVNANLGSRGSALFIASMRGYRAIVQLLLDKNADVDSGGGSRWGYGSPLEAAAGGGHKAIVQLLLGYGSNMDVNGHNFVSALRVASEEGYVAIVQLLQNKQRQRLPHQPKRRRQQ